MTGENNMRSEIFERLQNTVFEDEQGGEPPDVPGPMPWGPREESEAMDAYSKAVVSVVERCGPAVVSITVKGKGRRRASGMGSGFVLTPDGFVVTNSHVVDKARSIRVRWNNGEQREARLVGSDPSTDLALLSVSAQDLPFVGTPDGATARPGQLVVAIGNPLGFDATVSAGVLSATGRTLSSVTGRPIHNILQHTAPLNPGNSGGPLLSGGGALLGVNTAIIARAQGIGFAVPVETVCWVVPRLLSEGRVRRSYLGIVGRRVRIPARLVNRHSLSTANAVLVEHIERKSPAATAGLRTGDLLLTLAGAPIPGIDSLQRFLADWSAGREARVRLLRGEDARNLFITPTEAR